MQIALIPFCMLIMYSSSCKKDKPTICSKENTVVLPIDAVNRFFFNDSSYWIYQDSASGLIDSLWVYETSSGVGNLEKINPSSKGKCFEGFTVKFYSKFYKYNLNVACVGSPLGTPYEKEEFDVNYIQDNIHCDGFSLKSWNQYEVLDSDYGKIYHKDSITINNIQYYNVLINSNIDALGNYIYLESFYAPNIGMIRYKLRNGSVWNMIRNKLKK